MELSADILADGWYVCYTEKEDDRMEWLRNICKQREEELIALRRALHRVPEIGLRLPRTKAIVCAKLDQLGISYKENKGDVGTLAHQ